MDLNTMSTDEIQELSMIEVAYTLMQDQKQPIEYYELVDRIAKIKGLSKAEVKEKISFLYTDLNTDGRFITLGENRWGLKAWYPLDQIEEPVPAATPKKKKKRSDEDDDLDLVDDSELDDSEEDEFEDIADELDEISSEEDASDEDYDDKDDLDGFDEDDDSEDDEDEEMFEDEEEEER